MSGASCVTPRGQRPHVLVNYLPLCQYLTCQQGRSRPLLQLSFLCGETSGLIRTQAKIVSTQVTQSEQKQSGSCCNADGFGCCGNAMLLRRCLVQQSWTDLEHVLYGTGRVAVYALQVFFSIFLSVTVFLARCEANACSRFIGTYFSLRSSILSYGCEVRVMRTRKGNMYVIYCQGSCHVHICPVSVHFRHYVV